MTMIYVDADACPVKPEVIRVAKRHGLEVTFVANSRMRLPEEWEAKLVIVDDQLDAADDWIVEHVAQGDIVVTGDIPLADRAIKAGVAVIEPNGRIFTAENIGNILALRDLLHDRRGAGENMGGPAPFRKEDRSCFLQGLEQMIQKLKQ
ncbi:MAG: YaiI/YqxD family protein [Candidatus Omnitrophota bacterium]|nr:YaiI/YqxD family protein [Candidatus Omnitrophota bacterium]